MKTKFKLQVSPSCWFRKCHPQTCICNTPYVVHNYKVLAEVNSIEEGNEWIKRNKHLYI